MSDPHWSLHYAHLILLCGGALAGGSMGLALNGLFGALLGTLVGAGLAGLFAVTETRDPLLGPHQ